MIHCDKGKTFESNLIKNLAETHKMQIVYSSPYHHCTNGIIERQFRTVRDAIHISLKDKFYNNCRPSARSRVYDKLNRSKSG